MEAKLSVFVGLLFCCAAWGDNIGGQPFHFPTSIKKSELLQQKSSDNHYRHSENKELIQRFQKLEVNEEDSNLSVQCYADFIGFVTGLSRNKTFPLLVLDAFGRPESGQILGNFQWMGDFDECLLVSGHKGTL